MAAVFAATHRNGLRGAVKILSMPFSQDSDVRARFLREGYIANRVDHPGAVRVLDDDTMRDGRAFLVMELLEGRPLHTLAESQGGRLDPALVLCIADHVLDVLAAAHDKAIVHRDIKPENLFLTTEGHVKVLDFGIARIDSSTGSGPRATQSGAPMGTPAFMAPEQARGRWDLVGPQSDLWSLGASMFTLLSGAVVHDEQTVAETLSAAFTKPARSIAAAVPTLPGPIAHIVDRALSLEMAARWPEARAMQTAVRNAYHEVFGATLPTLVAKQQANIVRSRSSTTPISRSVLDGNTRPSPSRIPRKRSLFAIASVVVLALAAAELHGSATAASPEAHPPLASALADAVPTPMDAWVSPGDDVSDYPSALVVKSTPSDPPTASQAQAPSPVLSHRARTDLKALFDRRH
jgi:serine/threonine-protein kinase